VVVAARSSRRLCLSQRKAIESAKDGRVSWKTHLWPVLVKEVGGKVAEVDDLTRAVRAELPLTVIERQGDSLEKETVAAAQVALHDATAACRSELERLRRELSRAQVQAIARDLSIGAGAAHTLHPHGWHKAHRSAVQARIRKLHTPLNALVPFLSRASEAHVSGRLSLEEHWERMMDARVMDGDTRALEATTVFVCRRRDSPADELAANALPIEVSATVIPTVARRDWGRSTAAEAVEREYAVLGDLALSPRTCDPTGMHAMKLSGATVVTWEYVGGVQLDALVRVRGACHPAWPVTRFIISELVGWAVDVVGQCRGRVQGPPIRAANVLVGDMGMRVVVQGVERGPCDVDCVAPNLSWVTRGLFSVLEDMGISSTSTLPPPLPSSSSAEATPGVSRRLSSKADASCLELDGADLPPVAWLGVGEVVVFSNVESVEVLHGDRRVVGRWEEESAFRALLSGEVTMGVRVHGGAAPVAIRMVVCPPSHSQYVRLVRGVLALGQQAALHRLASALEGIQPSMDDVCESYGVWTKA
jgi:hypothetical protein